MTEEDLNRIKAAAEKCGMSASELLRTATDDYISRMEGTDISTIVDLAVLKKQEPITGETSDGYHTFNELYHHRAVLFSVIVANYPDMAWKSKKHHDGTMYDNMFIVGIDTPDGQATYHYDVDPYWDMFKCRVLDNAPEFDGHTPAQAIERIGRLKEQKEINKQFIDAFNTIRDAYNTPANREKILLNYLMRNACCCEQKNY